MRMVTVSEAPGKLVWLRRCSCPCCLTVWNRSARASGWASHQAASSSSLANLGMGWWLIELTLLVDFLLPWSHRVGRDEADPASADGEDKSQAASSVGLAQGGSGVLHGWIGV